MRISYTQLKRLPVETADGRPVGHVCDLELEIEGQLVAAYMVRKHRLHPAVRIGRDEVVAITAKKIVVDNRVLVQENAFSSSPISNPEPVIMRGEG